jgi:tRNA-Thr(GGU) m(6)t(6)A37 methyltransferase TsaA
MTAVSIRYFVHDVDAAIAFYRDYFGFTEVARSAPGVAMLARGGLLLGLSAAGGGQETSDGALPQPGAWNRFIVEVEDLNATVQALSQARARFRGEVVEGAGGRRILIEDPSGNPVELFEPNPAEARLENSYDVRPIGHVESSLTDLAGAPKQGDAGAPDAWLVIDQAVREGIRDIGVGSDLLVLTWLHRARRDELSTVPGDAPGGRERGVFSTRSPARPNPIGLHRVSVVTVADNRLRVRPLEAVDGTPVIDIKPVIRPGEA